MNVPLTDFIIQNFHPIIKGRDILDDIIQKQAPQKRRSLKGMMATQPMAVLLFAANNGAKVDIVMQHDDDDSMPYITASVSY